jgi:hypothetical protein
MNSGQGFAALPGQNFSGLGVFGIAKNLPAKRFAADPVHDETLAKRGIIFKHTQDRWNRHASLGGMRQQRCFHGQSDRLGGAGGLYATRRPAENQGRFALVRHDVKSPCFLAGAARQTR